MMRLPAGATGFFDAGTFRELIPRGILTAGLGEPVHRGRNYGEKLVCRENHL